MTTVNTIIVHTIFQLSWAYTKISFNFRYYFNGKMITAKGINTLETSNRGIFIFMSCVKEMNLFIHGKKHQQCIWIKKIDFHCYICVLYTQWNLLFLHFQKKSKSISHFAALFEIPMLKFRKNKMKFPLPNELNIMKQT